jgi:hypothetical protein
MRTLLGDPVLARRMGRAGRHRIETEFDIRDTASRYEALYRNLLAEKT